MMTLGALILLLVLAGGGYAYYLYHSAEKTVSNIYEPAKATSGGNISSEPLDQGKKKPISILLMGVDERQGDRGRSDTLIDMTLNPETNTMQMVSIPRDIRTEIVGHGSVDKINSAYAYGGTNMAVKTVEAFTDTPIDYYVRINMEGLSDLVDAVGGITFNNDYIGFTYGGYTFNKGQIHLNGKQALAYVRMRHNDKNGDFGRNIRQRQVITAVINKAASFHSLSHYQDILNAIQNNVKTNLTFDDMKYIASNYRDARKNVISYEVKGQGKMIYSDAYGKDIYYLIVGEAERQKVHDMIMKQLGKSE